MTLFYEWHTADVFTFMSEWKGHADVIIADPVYSDPGMLNLVARLTGPRIMFCYPEDLCLLAPPTRPDQLCHWVKPVSTKNTSKKYSRFVEAICVWHGGFFNQEMHWSNRTGVFTDTLTVPSLHAWKKPQSLIEKLVQLHCPINGVVLDLFSGSGTTEDACRATDRSCISVEIDHNWRRR